MRRLISLAAALVLSAPCLAWADTPRAGLLRVLYVGDPDTDRARSFAQFLDEAFILINTVDRRTFDPTSVRNVDVVVLDWPQTDLAQNPTASPAAWSDGRTPLGDRRAWKLPTVLLGSTGHQLSAPWKIFGASGCTCYNPAAYDLRTHPIFDRPVPIEIGKLTRRPWPEEWTEWHDEEQVRVLPLVVANKKPRQPGWCTYIRDMAEAPEVEVLCGGVNTRTPSAAAVWRQGNLIHFGFDASPAELNTAGKAILINAIAYISRFTDDYPILETEPPFAGHSILTRTTIVRIIARNSSEEWEYLKANFDPAVLATAQIKQLPAFAGWYPSVREFLVPSADGLMTVDDDALALYIKPGRPEFFRKAIARLARPGEDAARARRLLARYAPPDSPGPAATAKQWSAWWKENGDYLFFTDSGGYRWYLDSWAKKRKVPTEKLRGEKRASH